MNNKSTDKKFRQIYCGRCGTCCTEPVVPVTDSDVRRICDATGKKVSDFVKFYSDEEMSFDPEAGLWIKFKNGKMAMGLKKRADACIFLSSTICCKIYEHRPMTCRTFPYMIDFDEHGNPEKVHLNKIVDCKSSRKGLSHLDPEVSNVIIEQKQDDSYYEKVSKWNLSGKKGGAKEFLAFLGFE